MLSRWDHTTSCVLVLAALPVSAYAADSDDDGISNPQDACRDEPETVNGYADLDGCPDELGRVRVVVKDLEGAAVPRAKVRLGDLTDFSGADGSATFTELMPGSHLTLRIEAAMYLVNEDTEVEVGEGESGRVVTLDWLPVPVQVRVEDPIAGAPVDAVVRVDGPGFLEPQRTGTDGEVVVELRPGPWKVQVYADHYLRSSFDLPLRPAAQPYALDVELWPTWTALPTLGVEFPAGEAVISADAATLLDRAAADLLAWKGVDVEVQGFADAGAHDDALDDARADAVVAYLLGRQVPVDRVYATGMGAWGEGRGGAGFRVVDPDEALSLPQRVRFGAGSDAVAEGSEGDVDDLAAVLRVHERARALVLGHAGADEPPGLADQRALAVVDRLAGLGVDAARLQARGVVDLGAGPGFVELLELPPPALKDRRVPFDAASSEVPAAGLPVIRAVAEAAKRHPTARIKVRGIGAAADGKTAPSIGLERAGKVVTALVALGAHRGRLVTASVTTQSAGVGFVVFELVSLSMAETLAFEPGSAAIGAGHIEALERVRRVLLEFPSAVFEIRGYAGGADASGGSLDALALSRAEAAVRWLVARGADPGRLTAVAVAEPAPDGRVELVVTSPVE